MRRIFAIAAMLVLAAPTLAMAAEEHGRGGPHPGAAAPHHPPGPMGGPHPGGPGLHQGGPPAHHPPGPTGGPHSEAHPGPAGPRPGAGGPPPGGDRFTYHGHPFNRAHAAPFVYPPGWVYRRWVIGGLLPPLFLAPSYYYSEWAALGLDPPPPGFQWVRYGPDLLLVNVTTGEVVETVYDAFY